MLKMLTVYYKKYELCFYSAVVFAVYSFLNDCETYVLDNLAFVSAPIKSGGEYQNNSEIELCEIPPHRRLNSYNFQNTIFYWTHEQFTEILQIEHYAYLVATIIAGICADKLGGHLMNLVGLVSSGVIMLLMYLSVFHDTNLFVVMVILRKFNNGIVKCASLSLLGKTTMQTDRPAVAGILFSGNVFGSYTGFCVSRLVGRVDRVCYLSGVVSLLAALCWCFYCRLPNFPKIQKTERIPWRETLTSISLYIVLFLGVTEVNIRRLGPIINSYLKKVVRLTTNRKYDWIYKLPLSLAEMFAALFCGLSNGYFISKTRCSASVVRALSLGAAVFIASCVCVIVSSAKCNTVVVAASAVAVHYSSGVAETVFLTICLDVAPSFAGTFLGITYALGWPYANTFTTLYRKYWVNSQFSNDLRRWRQFYFIFIIISVSCLFPILFFKIQEISARPIGDFIPAPTSPTGSTTETAVELEGKSVSSVKPK